MVNVGINISYQILNLCLKIVVTQVILLNGLEFRLE